MPPKSTASAKPASANAPPSSLRRSTRISAAPESQAKDTDAEKKRPAEDKPKSGPASKKAKASDSAAAGPKSDNNKDKPATKGKASKGKAANGAGEDMAKPAEEGEKEAEAPKDAPPTLPSKPKSSGSGKKLKEGDTLPSLTLQDETGADVDVSSLAGDKQGLVLFLYPKAATPGCTNQACGFRDAFDEIKALGYEVVGLSRDGPTAQKNWKTKQNLNYKLLCDPESKLIKRLGAFVEPKNTKRSHFIFEKGSGKLVDAQYGVKPADDPKSCLTFIKKHHK